MAGARLPSEDFVVVLRERWRKLVRVLARNDLSVDADAPLQCDIVAQPIDSVSWHKHHVTRFYESDVAAYDLIKILISVQGLPREGSVHLCRVVHADGTR